ncbi:helix-turn-helix transcriptional regulator [Streptomyces sp. DT2A-34]|uniref:helix-turn-helix transcriptional regulator n=1 Tax=Streptomyces sp. DT2A-34 TaxID=3051182 RepID=UPI00265B92C2|nr:helix-turn-helix transcriptional regulator [Streptomyces sp. DT2A-34]MDO0910956.1 helix-turn-helix transcriptional regulator [Streptomyces sp. DT2A-34]
MNLKILLAFGFADIRELDRAWKILYGQVLRSPHDQESGLVQIMAARSLLAYASGETDVAAVLSRRMLERIKQPCPSSTFAHFLLTLISLRNGDLKATSSYVKELTDDALMGRTCGWVGYIAWATAQVREAKYGAAAAAPLVEELVDFGPVSRRVLVSQPDAAAWLVRLALKTDQKALARQGAEAAQRLGRDNPQFRSLVAAASHAKGLDAQNPDYLWRAVETHKDPWARASALEDIAVLLHRRRQGVEDIAPVLERSGDAYLAVGAFRDVLRVKNRLWNLGVRSRTSRWPTLPSSEVKNLTRSETAVAELVAQGLTNSQVASQLSLSRHTVAFHLRKVFLKMSVTSRIELVRVWDDTVAR